MDRSVRAARWAARALLVPLCVITVGGYAMLTGVPALASATSARPAAAAQISLNEDGATVTGGGTVGGKSVTFNAKGTTPTVFVDSDCAPKVNTCFGSIIFVSGGNSPSPAADGFGDVVAGKKTAEVSILHQVLLSAPSGAYRQDGAVVDTSSPTWNAKTKTMSVTTTSAGIITGSAKLTGGSPKKSSAPCSYAGKKYTITSTTTETANYTSPAGQAITAHTSLTGNLVAANTTGTGFEDISTVKAK